MATDVQSAPAARLIVALRRASARLMICGSGVVLAVAAAPAAAAPAGAHAQRGLTLGFFDPVFTADPAASALWLGRAAASGADIVRVNAGWAAPDVPVRPAGFDARDPADPAYDFSAADAAVVAADARGLRVLVTFDDAPRWAEGPGRPASAPPGSWRPDPGALEDYGVALARRYSGSFPDPARPGKALPRVSAFQVWNEPNLDIYLSPQWKSGGQTAAPAHYRRMLSAFYRGVKSVRPDALVVSAGTAPFGDNGLGARHRTTPVRFVRDLLCLRLRAGRLRGRRCSTPARFDVLAHHPYTVGSPRTSASNLGNVSIPDIGRLTRLLRAAERTGGALPHERHRVWATEVSFDSRPPDPGGVSLGRQARFLAQSLYLLWRQGVDTITWYKVGDDLPVPSYGATYQSGVLFQDGRAKPAQRAFRFPFVARRSGAAVRVWGRAPVAGRLVVERRVGSSWVPVRTSVRISARGVFVARVPGHGAMTLRARIGQETSISARAG